MVILSVLQLVVLIEISVSLFVTPVPDHVPSYQIPQRELEVVKSLPMFYGVPKFEQFMYENSNENIHHRPERNEIFPQYPGGGGGGGALHYSHVYSTPAPQYSASPSPPPNYSASPSPTPRPQYYDASPALRYYDSSPPSYYGLYHHPLPEHREDNPHLQQNLVYTDHFFQSHPGPGYHKDYSKYVINSNYGENYPASLGKNDKIHLPLEVSPYHDYQQRELKPLRKAEKSPEPLHPFTPNPIHTVPAKPAISFIDPPAPPVVAPQPASHPATSRPPVVSPQPSSHLSRHRTVSPQPPIHSSSRPLVLSPQSPIHPSIRPLVLSPQPPIQPSTSRPLVLSPQPSIHTSTSRPLVLSPQPNTQSPKSKPQLLSPKQQVRQKLTFQDVRHVDPHQRQQQHQPARTSIIARQPKSLKISRLPTENSLIPARVKEGSRSAALLKLMEIAGEDWSSSKQEASRSGVSRTAKFSCPESEGHFPASDSCSVYYQCAQGTAHRRQCDTGLYWSVETDMCDWRENVKCHRGAR